MKSLIPPFEAQLQLQPFFDRVGLPALPLHAHEVLFAFCLYHFIFVYAAPTCSNWLFPKQYGHFDYHKDLNWRLQCVSFVQSIVISATSLWVMSNDPDRAAMKTATERVCGYSSGPQSVAAFALGYFLWELMVTSQNFEDQGLGVFLHAVSCVTVYSLGFKPAFNYWGCVFVLYELSTPFLNVLRFLEQLGKQSNKVYTINGICLMVSFFGARLIYGNYSSILWYIDIYKASTASDAERDRFRSLARVNSWPSDEPSLPWWVIAAYTISNITLNTLNVIWFSKMVRRARRSLNGQSRKTNIEG